jgi:hypothetical protein
MRLIIWYLMFLVVGGLLTYGIGFFVEREWGSHASLIAFLGSYFFFLWLAWVLAVRFTKPKDAVESPEASAASTLAEPARR